MNVPWVEFDLSALTYPQFLAFFFDRPTVGDDGAYDLFRSGVDGFVASDPATVVEHVRAMCQDFAELAKVYSSEQLDQGLWAVFGSGISCERYLFDPSVESQLRIDSVESMYLPFRDVVTRHSGDIQETFYWMWWDMILHTLWSAAEYDDSTLNDPALRDDPERFFEALNELMSKTRAFRPFEHNFGALTNDQKQVSEAIYRTLSRILALDHRGCQRCALHGLGHSYHPLSGVLVQSYLDAHRGELSGQDEQWIEACRDHRVQ
jgi:hypothetical protein